MKHYNPNCKHSNSVYERESWYRTYNNNINDYSKFFVRCLICKASLVIHYNSTFINVELTPYRSRYSIETMSGIDLDNNEA